MFPGCFNSDVEETVWETYEGDNFVLSYPGEGWKVISEKNETVVLANTGTNINTNQIITYISNFQPISTDTEWNDFKILYSSVEGIEHSLEILVDEYPAYKIHRIENISGIKTTYDEIYIYDTRMKQ